jgi:hypothetical protein
MFSAYEDRAPEFAIVNSVHASLAAPNISGPEAACLICQTLASSRQKTSSQHVLYDVSSNRNRIGFLYGSRRKGVYVDAFFTRTMPTRIHFLLCSVYDTKAVANLSLNVY